MPRSFVRSAAATLIACGFSLASATAQDQAPPPPPPRPAEAGKPLSSQPTTPAATPTTPAEPKSFIRFGAPTPIAKPAGALRVAVYNIENLFDDQDDPAQSGEWEDKDNLKPDSQCKGVAAAIKAMDADVIGLTEIESKDALVWFMNKYMPDSPYKYVESIDAGDERGIEQAVISKYPISDVKNWPRLPLGGVQPEKWGNGANRDAGKPLTYHRSPLCATVTVPAKSGDAAAEPYVITLFVTHQKSGQPGGFWREKEATKTAELIKELQMSAPDRNIILMGDLNARPDDKPVKIFTDAGLIDVFAPVRKKGDPLYITHESNRTIDFLLLSPSAEKELIKETRFILGTPARPAGVDYRTTPGPEGYASDHYPVVIDLMPVDRP